MSLIEYKYKNPSTDVNILTISSRIITEHVIAENSRSESINNRANLSICLIGIYATILLAFTSVMFGQNSNTISIISKFFFIGIMIILVISVFDALKVILVKQVEKLSPDMVNDIQSFTEAKALKYEIEWKMWEYNKLNANNSSKLFSLHRVQRNLLFSTFNLLIMILLVYFNDYIYSCQTRCFCFTYLEFVIGFIVIIYSIFINPILEKNSFWYK